jgi:erythromycin esterase
MDDTAAALTEHARPLALTQTRSAGRDDAVDGVVPPDAAVVGVGEATHGTREFGRVANRLVRHLVERRGFRTVAVEADVAATLALDDRVSGVAARGRPGGWPGAGDDATVVAEALPALGWRFDTEESVALFAWLRAFNRGRPPADRVRVHGVDSSTPRAPAEALVGLLRGTDALDAGADPDAAGDVTELAALAERSTPDEAAARERYLDDVGAAARRLGERLDERQPVEASDEEGPTGRARAAAWHRARHLGRVVERTCSWHRVRHEHPGPHAEGMAERDRLLAENVAWAAERDHGAGVVLLAHAGHVQRGTFDDGRAWTDAATAGEHLHRALGERYRVVGTDFVRGAFRARPADGGDPQSFRVGDPPEASATARFAALGDGPTVLDLAAAGADPRLASLFDRPRRVRLVGSVYDPGEEHALETDLPASFDALVVVGESTPTRPPGVE